MILAGFDVSEIPGSPESNWSTSEARVRRTFDLEDYEEAWSFARNVLGYSAAGIRGGDGKKYIHRVVPQPTYLVKTADSIVVLGGNGGVVNTPELYWVYATGVENIRGIGPRATDEQFDQAPNYQKARIALQYTSLTYRVADDGYMVSNGWAFAGAPDESTLQRYVTRFIAPSVDYIDLPFKDWKWASDESRINHIAGFHNPSDEVMYVWHAVPEFPSHVLTYLGCVNKTAFDDASAARAGHPGDYSFVKQTLLLTGISVTPFRQILSSSFHYDITYKMKLVESLSPMGLANPVTIEGTPSSNPAEPYGHNHFLRYRTQADKPTYYWDLVTSNGKANGTRPYKQKEFRNLFRLQEDS